MCTTISQQAVISGSGKGQQGWFTVDQVSLGYDHPTHARLDHAVLLDFRNRSAGVDGRVAVELTKESARELAHLILDTLEQAERSGM